MTSVFIRHRKGRNTGEKAIWKWRQRLESCCHNCQETTRTHLGEAKRGPGIGPLEGDTLISDSWPFVFNFFHLACFWGYSCCSAYQYFIPFFGLKMLHLWKFCFFVLFFLNAVLKFELRASHLLGMHPTTWPLCQYRNTAFCLVIDQLADHWVDSTFKAVVTRIVLCTHKMLFFHFLWLCT
jgi:hypothetical protein